MVGMKEERSLYKNIMYDILYRLVVATCSELLKNIAISETSDVSGGLRYVLYTV